MELLRRVLVDHPISSDRTMPLLSRVLIEAAGRDRYANQWVRSRRLRTSMRRG